MALLDNRQASAAPPATPPPGAPPPETPEGQGLLDEKGGDKNMLSLTGMRLLYGEKSFPSFVEMIRSGDDGATKVAIQIGDSVFNKLLENNEPFEDEEFMEAAQDLVGEIAEIGDRVGVNINPENVLFKSTAAFIQKNGQNMDLAGMEESLRNVSQGEMTQATRFLEGVAGLQPGEIGPAGMPPGAKAATQEIQERGQNAKSGGLL